MSRRSVIFLKKANDPIPDRRDSNILHREVNERMLGIEEPRIIFEYLKSFFEHLRFIPVPSNLLATSPMWLFEFQSR